MSGHQAGFWHAGILAKRFALQAVAEASGAAPAWLVVDHDTNDAGAIRYPVMAEGGRIGERTLRIAPKTGAPTGLIPSAARPEAPNESTESFVRSGLGAIINALRPAESLAAQIHMATERLIDEAPVTSVFSSKLAKTDLFGSIVEHVRADPERCRASFNEAVTGTSVARLSASELPFWDLSGQVRRRLRDEHLTALDVERLAPTAILQTMLLRAAGCDLFIHGTGAVGTETEEGYENATTRWRDLWSPPLPDLAPIAVSTATLTLPLGGGEGVPSERELAHLTWRAHHIRHTPADEELKRSLLSEIEAAPRQSRRRYELFLSLHEMLKNYRTGAAAEIRTATSEAENARLRRLDATLIDDRTWPFPLHPRERLLKLRDSIRGCFGL
ncbi:MAG: hypothetical protein AAGB51_03645 [Planctomycetota bacterium]